MVEEFQPSPEFIAELKKKLAEAEERKKFPTPEINHFRLGPYIFRTIYSMIVQRPGDEHLHEFICQHLFNSAFNVRWFEAESKKPVEEQHVVARWSNARFRFMKECQKLNIPAGQLVTPNGETRELVSLAADVYYLELVHELPRRLKERLRNRNEFQGARYEVAVAASMIRAGFQVTWADERHTNRKIPEFNAYQAYTEETIAVEAKSRRRKGTLHQEGQPDNIDEATLDIFSLYNKAMEKDPGTRPFGVFIDINLPRYFDGRKTWGDLFFEKLSKERLSMFGRVVPSFLAITNCAWHYDGERQATKEEFILYIPPKNTRNLMFPLRHSITEKTLKRSLEMFSKIPDESLK